MHTVLTGLQNDNIKSDLHHYLTKPDTPDELLLEKVNIACTNEMERQDKKRHAAPQRATSVSTVQSGELPEETKPSTQQSRPYLPHDVLSEIKEMRSDMVLMSWIVIFMMKRTWTTLCSLSNSALLNTICLDVPAHAHIHKALQRPLCDISPHLPPHQQQNTHAQYKIEALHKYLTC